MKNLLTPTAPSGLHYQDIFLSPAEEMDIIQGLHSFPVEPFTMRGVISRRQVAHFGWDYAYDAWTIRRTTPIPDFLLPFRERAAKIAALNPLSFEAVLVNAYPVGAGIGWHRDAPMFGECVLGISLLSACQLKFRRETAAGYLVYPQTLAPRSLYVMAGEARSVWQHTIPPAKVARYSITFRTVKQSVKDRLNKGD